MTNHITKTWFDGKTVVTITKEIPVEEIYKREWVGLTEVDILAASRHWRHAEDFLAGVYWAAGTLKEKNT